MRYKYFMGNRTRHALFVLLLSILIFVLSGTAGVLVMVATSSNAPDSLANTIAFWGFGCTGLLGYAFGGHSVAKDKSSQ